MRPGAGRHNRLAVRRFRSGAYQVLGSRGNHGRQRRRTGGRLEMGAERDAPRGVRHTAGSIPSHPHHGGRQTLPIHDVHASGGARRRRRARNSGRSIPEPTRADRSARGRPASSTGASPTGATGTTRVSSSTAATGCIPSTPRQVKPDADFGQDGSVLSDRGAWPRGYPLRVRPDISSGGVRRPGDCREPRARRGAA